MNNYKFLAIIIAMAFHVSLLGQSNEIEDKIESRRIAFLSSTLELSTTEAQEFWPVYNEYKKEMSILKDAARAERELNKTPSNETINDYFEREQKILNLRKEYSLKTVKIIGAERTMRLLKSERKFKEKMLKGIKDNRRERRGHER